MPSTDEGDLPDFDDVVVPDDYVPDLDSILHTYQDTKDPTFTPAMQEAAALSMALARSRPPVNLFHPLPAQNRPANSLQLAPAGNFFQVGDTTSPLDTVMDTGLAGQEQLRPSGPVDADAMELTNFLPLDFDPSDLGLDDTDDDASFEEPL